MGSWRKELDIRQAVRNNEHKDVDQKDAEP